MEKTRRSLKPSFKFQIVLEAIQERQTQAELARQYNLHPRVISQWKRQFLKQGPSIFSAKQEARQKDKKIEELEKIIGRQTIEIQFLKKVLGSLD